MINYSYDFILYIITKINNGNKNMNKLNIYIKYIYNKYINN